MHVIVIWGLITIHAGWHLIIGVQILSVPLTSIETLAILTIVITVILMVTRSNFLSTMAKRIGVNVTSSVVPKVWNFPWEG